MGPKHTGELWMYIGSPLFYHSGNTGVMVCCVNTKWKRRHGWRSGWAIDCCAACHGFNSRTKQISLCPTDSCSRSSCLCMLVYICLLTHSRYRRNSKCRGKIKKQKKQKKMVVCKVGLRSRCLRDNVMTGSARDETGDRSVSLSLYLRSRSWGFGVTQVSEHVTRLKRF